MESSVWTPERIAEVVSAHGVDRAYRLDLNGADALGFWKDDVFIVAAGSVCGARDARFDTVPFRWRDTLERLGAIRGGEFVDDEKFTSADVAAVVVSGSPSDAGSWNPVRGL